MCIMFLIESTHVLFIRSIVIVLFFLLLTYLLECSNLFNTCVIMIMHIKETASATNQIKHCSFSYITVWF